eukprot:augustus_masked-scaffold_7-processed-gene-10.4-mRNA-1 protein AED:0.01 eAED:0.01 QI:0/-1/0/1/-1/1/1/0/240
MGDSAYSYSLTTFSNSGKLIQIEHALRGVQERGKLLVGICATDGVVLATTKKLPTLSVPSTFKKVCPVSPHIITSYSGMSPDFRILLSKSRKESQTYHQKFGVSISTTQLTKKTAEVMQEFTQQGGVRPFGVSVLIAGWDEDLGAKLYQADASGAYFEWKATAIGNKFVDAKSFLEKRLFQESDDITYDYEQAVDEAVRCLKQNSDTELKPDDLEIGVVDRRGYRLLNLQEIQTILENIN